MKARTITLALLALALTGPPHALAEDAKPKQDRQAAKQPARASARPAPPRQAPPRAARPATRTRPAARPAPRAPRPAAAPRPTARPTPRATQPRSAQPRPSAQRPTSRRAPQSANRNTNRSARPQTATTPRFQSPSPQTNRPSSVTRPSRPTITQRPSAARPRPTLADRPRQITSTRPRTFTPAPRTNRPAARPSARPNTRPDTRPAPSRGRTGPDRPDQNAGRSADRPVSGDIRIEPLPRDGINANRPSRPGNRPDNRPANRPTRPGPTGDGDRADNGRANPGRGAGPRASGFSNGHDAHTGSELSSHRDTRRAGRSGGHHDDHGHHGGHHDDHHGHHGHHKHRWHHYSHGHYHDHYHGLGFWISFRGSSWWYCPTYRRHTYVYLSPTYTNHYYYGAGSGTSADRAVESLELGWRALEDRRLSSARRHFAKASSLSPTWGLPRIGYALALAASDSDRSAESLMRRAFAEDPFAALEVPYSPELDALLLRLDDRLTDEAHRGIYPRRAWFLASTVRVLLNDPDGAVDAAFNAESAGASTDAINGIYEVLSRLEQQQQTP